MTVWRRSQWADPARWYVLIGVAMLVASIWVPFLTAQRTARTEQRADAIAAALLAVVDEHVEPIDAAAGPVVFARCLRLALCEGAYVGDLEQVEAPPDVLLCLQNKHYLFHLAISPPDQAAVVGHGTVPSYEVMAWPRERLGPAHTAFFYPDDALRVYSRNLAANHFGLGRQRPRPGTNHRRTSSQIATDAYRSVDDERWIPY